MPYSRHIDLRVLVLALRAPGLALLAVLPLLAVLAVLTVLTVLTGRCLAGRLAGSHSVGYTSS